MEKIRSASIGDERLSLTIFMEKMWRNTVVCGLSFLIQPFQGNEGFPYLSREGFVAAATSNLQATKDLRLQVVVSFGKSYSESLEVRRMASILGPICS